MTENNPAIIDWNALWRDVNNTSRNARNTTSEFWDGFAETYWKKPKEGERDRYTEQFYDYMEINPGESIFDMGCASGVLAIPYAQRGHEIYAADYSTRMLEVLMKNAEAEGVADRIHPIHLDWNEDWNLRDLPVCDIAIASRSLIFDDLTSSLKKLESVASRRICLGVWDVPTIGFDRYVAKAIEYERPGLATNSIVMGELMSRGACPEARIIKSPFRLAKYESFREGYETLRNSFSGGLTERQEKLLEDYCTQHLIHKQEEGLDFWQLDHSNISTMTFISWGKEFITGKIEQNVKSVVKTTHKTDNYEYNTDSRI